MKKLTRNFGLVLENWRFGVRSSNTCFLHIGEVIYMFSIS